MKTLRKIPLVPLSLVSLVMLALGLSQFAARAQDNAVATWQDAGIGTGGTYQTDASGVYTVTAGGGDIWGSSDSFNYVYEPLNGNGQMTARVVGIQGMNIWAKAGVMIRETL